MRWVLAVAFAGCYSPSNQPCAISCNTDSECPTGLACVAGKACAPANTSCLAGDAGDPDAAVDAPILENGCAGLSNGLVRHLCLDPQTSLIAGAVIDTDGVMCDISSVAGACVIAATSITVPVITTVTGSRPLILWSSTTIEITGSLDAASHVFGTPGPGSGATAAVCAAVDGAENTNTSPQIGSGGVGATYSSVGGKGGDGRNGAPVGTVNLPQDPIGLDLHGGCNGGNGGISSANAGHGGGAIYLMAHDSIRVTGTIDASGSGGLGGGTGNTGMETGGGGGGGAGGLIAFDAPTVELDGAALLALGGGGGGGSARLIINSMIVIMGGDPGSDPMNGLIGGGGLATTAINGGGDGSSLGGGVAGNGGNVNGGSIGGGGGGGGGAGFIVRFGVAKLGGEAPTSHPPVMQN